MNTTKTLLLAGVSALLLISCVTRRVKTSLEASANISMADPIFVAIAPGQTIQARRLLEPIESVMREQGFRLAPQKEAHYILYSRFRGVISKAGKYGAISVAVFPLKDGGDKVDTKDVWEGAVRLREGDFEDSRDAIRSLLSKFGNEYDGTLRTPAAKNAP